MFSTTFANINTGSFDPNYPASLTVDCEPGGGVYLYTGAFADMSHVQHFKVSFSLIFSKYLLIFSKYLLIFRKYLIIFSKYLLIFSKYLIIFSKYLIIFSKFLIIFSKYLIIFRKYLIIFRKYLIIFRKNLETIERVSSLCSRPMIDFVVSLLV